MFGSRVKNHGEIEEQASRREGKRNKIYALKGAARTKPASASSMKSDQSALGSLHESMGKDASVVAYRKKIKDFESQNPFKPHPGVKISYPSRFDELLQSNTLQTYRMYRPYNSKSTHTLFYIPGTAFVVHETGFTDVFCSLLSKLLGVKVIALYHRLSPEHPSPTAYEDCEQLIRGFLKRASSYGIDPDDIGIAGYSSGGTLAALLTQQEKFNFKYQLLFSPLTDLTLKINKRRPRDAIVKENFLEWAINLFEPNLAKNGKTDLPSLATLKPGKMQLPLETFMFYGIRDIVRLDCQTYVEKIKAATKDTGQKKVYEMIRGDNHGYAWRELDVMYQMIEFVKAKSKMFDKLALILSEEHIQEESNSRSQDLMSILSMIGTKKPAEPPSAKSAAAIRESVASVTQKKRAEEEQSIARVKFNLFRGPTGKESSESESGVSGGSHKSEDELGKSFDFSPRIG